MKDFREQYTKRDIVKILDVTGLSVRTVQYYTDFGIVVPDISPSQGKGKIRIYSEGNLIQFGMVEYMKNINVDLDTIKLIMDGLRKGVDSETVEVSGNFENIKKKEHYFRDFIQSSQWGVSKELIFIEEITAHNPYKGKYSNSTHTFRVITKRTPLLEFDPEGGVPYVASRILWLGGIKRYSIEHLLGMKHLLNKEAPPF